MLLKIVYISISSDSASVIDFKVRGELMHLYLKINDFKAFKFRLHSDAQVSIYKFKNFSLQSLLNLINFLDEYINLEMEDKNFFKLAEAHLEKENIKLLFYFYLNDENFSFEALAEYIFSFKTKLSNIYAHKHKAEFNVNLTLFKASPEGQFYIEIKDLAYLLDVISIIINYKNSKLAKCSVCKSFFIRNNYQNGDLCKYKHILDITCTEKRCQKNAKHKIEADSLLLEYQRLYKRIYMRVERQIDRSPKFKFDETPAELKSFRIWSKKASQFRKDYLNRNISPQKFSKALSQLEESSKNIIS